MAKQIQLKIAEPCHEDWAKMTKSEKGKFCNSCQKQVIDFTGMTDAQLGAFFKRKSTDSVCGRFYDDQLERGIQIPRKRIPWVKYFFQITLPIFLASCKLKAQQGKVMVETIQKESCSSNMVLGGISRQVSVNTILKGTIIDHDGKPVPYATIDRGIKGIAADSTGAFSLPVVMDEKGIKLNVSSVGYESKEVVLTSEEIYSNKPLEIRLTPNNLMKEVVINSNENLYFTGTVGMVSIISYKPEPEPEVLTSPEPQGPGFKMYANLASANSHIYINPGEIEAGIYSVQLFNLSGQLIKQEQVNFNKGMGAIPFSVPSIIPGTYVVTLLNKKTGKKSSEKLIVQ